MASEYDWETGEGLLGIDEDFYPVRAYGNDLDSRDALGEG